MVVELSNLKRSYIHSRSNLARGSDQSEWLEPHQCVQQVEHSQNDFATITDLFRAIRINVLLRTRYVDLYSHQIDIY